MNFNKHSAELEGKHSFLSPSSYYWLNYSDEKLREVYLTSMAKERGTQLHAFAANAIKLGVKLPKNRNTLNAYVNDAIGFRMTPEQLLFYSYNVFGTADAIAFKDDFLRVHDLKTGVVTASEKRDLVGGVYLFLPPLGGHCFRPQQPYGKCQKDRSGLSHQLPSPRPTHSLLEQRQAMFEQFLLSMNKNCNLSLCHSCTNHRIESMD